MAPPPPLPTPTRSFLPSPEAVKVIKHGHVALTAPSGQRLPRALPEGPGFSPHPPTHLLLSGNTSQLHSGWPGTGASFGTPDPTGKESFLLPASHPFPGTPLRSPSLTPSESSPNWIPSRHSLLSFPPPCRLCTGAFPANLPPLSVLHPTRAPQGSHQARGQKLPAPSKARGHWRGSFRQGGARCPSLGASEGHSAARLPLGPSSILGGLEPRSLCQGLRNSGWWQGPLPISFLLHLSKGTLRLRGGLREEQKGTPWVALGSQSGGQVWSSKKPPAPTPCLARTFAAQVQGWQESLLPRVLEGLLLCRPCHFFSKKGKVG